MLSRGERSMPATWELHSISENYLCLSPGKVAVDIHMRRKPVKASKSGRVNVLHKKEMNGF